MLSARSLAESFFSGRVVRRLEELGYRAGSSMMLEFRSAEGVASQFAVLARELGGLKCDLKIAVGPEHGAKHLRDASPSTPLVFLAVDYDPLESGLVSNLARPGSNTTGVYIPQAALATKRLEIITEIVPRARRLLVFVDPFSKTQLPAVRTAAATAGIQLMVIEFSKAPYDFEAAFAEAAKAKVEAYIELASPVLAANARHLAALLQKYGLPGVAASGHYVQAGVLMSYGPEPEKVARQVADIGARILKGAKAGEVPVQQADEFELVINSKTAAALGLKIPERVLARATKIVD
jgi:putative ABC transport system substrate-binding protein